MKLKTSLIAAATLAVGVIASQAQVYSQNVVGYYNVTVPGTSTSSGFYIFANQFNCGVSNGLNEVISSGLQSDVNGGTNTLAYLWVPGGAGTLVGPYQYFSAADAAADSSPGAYDQGAGFYDGGGAFYNPILKPGSTIFIKNLSSAPITLTVSGQVPQGTNNVSMLAGYNMISSPIPVSTNLTSNPLGFVGTSDVNGTYNDTLYIWSPTGNTFFGPYQYFNAADAASDSSPGAYDHGAGFYDGGGTWQPAMSSPPVGSGFFLYHYGANGLGGTQTWTNVFTVQ